jgi:hypothetical protein
LIKIYIKNINIYDLWYIISIIGKIFESVFLINLFRDINVTRIFTNRIELMARILTATDILGRGSK